METQFITDEQGKRIGVILSIQEYERLTALEEVEVPEWQQEIVNKRRTLTGDNIDNYIPLEELKEHFNR